MYVLCRHACTAVLFHTLNLIFIKLCQDVWLIDITDKSCCVRGHHFIPVFLKLNIRLVWPPHSNMVHVWLKTRSPCQIKILVCKPEAAFSRVFVKLNISFKAFRADWSKTKSPSNKKLAYKF